jgi:hypothetical protein
MIINKTPEELPPAPDVGEGFFTPLQLWAEKVGAVDGGSTGVEVTVQGRSTAAVVLHALHVEVVERSSPFTAPVYQVGECGAGVSPRHFSVNLDDRLPAVKSVPGQQCCPLKKIPAVDFPFKISEDEPEVFIITASTVRCDCSWYLELEWSSQGGTGTLRIDDDGKPFRTMGFQGLADYQLGVTEGGESTWRPVNG